MRLKPFGKPSAFSDLKPGALFLGNVNGSAALCLKVVSADSNAELVVVFRPGQALRLHSAEGVARSAALELDNVEFTFSRSAETITYDERNDTAAIGRVTLIADRAYLRLLPSTDAPFPVYVDMPAGEIRGVLPHGCRLCIDKWSLTALGEIEPLFQFEVSPGSQGKK
jgi:hypothetical protein